jgi:hypothetical protein
MDLVVNEGSEHVGVIFLKYRPIRRGMNSTLTPSSRSKRLDLARLARLNSERVKLERTLRALREEIAQIEPIEHAIEDLIVAGLVRCAQCARAITRDRCTGCGSVEVEICA